MAKKAKKMSAKDILDASKDARAYKLPAKLGRRPLRSGLMIFGRPEAEAALALNTHNRIMSMSRAEEYARIMLAGEWQLVNDAICFSNQELKNGQTRCMAIMLASEVFPEIEIPFHVMVGITPKARMDAQRPRSAAQNLQLEGYENAKALAAAARLFVQYANTIGGVEETDLLYLSASRTHCSPTKIEQAVTKEHRGLITSLQVINSVGTVYKITTPNVLTVMHYIGERAARETPAPAAFRAVYPEFDYSKPAVVARQIADEFITRLVTGVNLEHKTPIYSLREKLLRVKAETKNRGSTRLPSDKLAMCIRAWNVWRADPEQEFTRIYGLSTSKDRPLAMPVAE